MNDYTEIFKKMYYEIFNFLDKTKDKRYYFGGDMYQAPYFVDGDTLANKYVDGFGGNFENPTYHITAIRINKLNNIEAFIDFGGDAELVESEEEFWDDDCFQDDLSENWKRVNDVRTVIGIHEVLRNTIKKDMQISLKTPELPKNDLLTFNGEIIL